MPKLRHAFFIHATLLTTLLATVFARADVIDATVDATAATDAQSQAPHPFGTAVLDEQALAQYRGGTEVLNDMGLKGVVSDNQAYDLSTGNNSITEGALAGSSGIPMLIQNSGNNVLIQNATIVNVQLQ
jgi:hypothetical protein